MESLRFEAVRMLREENRQYPDRIALINAESAILLRQLEMIDRAVQETMTRDGQLEMYRRWNTAIDMDAPDDPTDLVNERIAFRYCLARYYRRLFDVSWSAHHGGCWPLINGDLLAPFDGKRVLLTTAIPVAILQHPSAAFVGTLTVPQLREFQQTFSQIESDAARRLGALRLPMGYDIGIQSQPRRCFEKVEKTKQVLQGLIEYAVGAQREARLLESWILRNDSAGNDQITGEEWAEEREQFECSWNVRFKRVGVIEAASDHIDMFARNREQIGALL